MNSKRSGCYCCCCCSCCCCCCCCYCCRLGGSLFSFGSSRCVGLPCRCAGLVSRWAFAAAAAVAEETFEAEISAMCLEALQQPQQQQHKILEMKSFRLACNKTDADVAEVVVMTVLQQLALKAPRCKSGWASFVEVNRCRTLLSAFLNSSADASCLFGLWGRVVAFCSNKEIAVCDPEGAETRSSNPFEGPHGFCEVAELLHAADLFDVDTSLPRWAAAAAAAAAGDTTDALAVESLRLLHAPSDVLAFLETPRLKAFVNWLQEDEDDDESDASQD
ncbi:hypothetical protein Emag_000249 [Eimeria magna]